MAQKHRATHPMEVLHLPAPTKTWSDLETVERTQVKKGIEKQVEMIALETHDRDREPETPTFTYGVTLADIAKLPQRCGE